MKRPSTLLAACVILAACHDATPVPTAVVPPIQVQPPTWVVFGTVRDDDGKPVFGAVAEIVTGKYAGQTAISNASGYFSFSRVSGEMTIRVFRDGYDRFLRTITVSGDIAIEIRLGIVLASDTIQLGQTIRATVASDAPPCDPIRWDARAPCKTFRFKAPANGTLVIVISWDGGPELDATMVEPNNAYVATSTSSGRQDVMLVGPVVAGQTYEIRVNAYYTGQVFTLRADLNAPVRN